MGKITKKQRSLLSEINLHPISCSDSYAPAIKLVDLGLAEWSWGGLTNPRLAITAAGTAIIAEEMRSVRS